MPKKSKSLEVSAATIERTDQAFWSELSSKVGKPLSGSDPADEQYRTRWQEIFTGVSGTGPANAVLWTEMQALVGQKLDPSNNSHRQYIRRWLILSQSFVSTVEPAQSEASSGAAIASTSQMASTFNSAEQFAISTYQKFQMVGGPFGELPQFDLPITSPLIKLDTKSLAVPGAESQFLSEKKPSIDGQLTGPYKPASWPAGAPAFRSYDEALGSGHCILYVNGINTSPEEHVAAAQELANVEKAYVVGIFNKSDGFLKDLVQCGEDKVGFELALRKDPSVRTATLAFKKFGTNLQVVAHSQGSIIVSAALFLAKDSGSSISGIDLTTLGNAIQTLPTGLKSNQNFVHDSDVVPGLVGSSSLPGSLYNYFTPIPTPGGGVLTDSNAYMLHDPGSGLDPHHVIPYIDQLPEFQAKEARIKARDKKLGHLAGPLDSAESDLQKQEALLAMVVAQGRGLGGWGDNKIGEEYNERDALYQVTGALASAGIQSGYSYADRGMRQAGKYAMSTGSGMLRAAGTSTSTGIQSAYSATDQGARQAGNLAMSVGRGIGDAAEMGINFLAPSFLRSPLQMGLTATRNVAGMTADGIAAGYGMLDKGVRGTAQFTSNVVSGTYNMAAKVARGGIATGYGLLDKGVRETAQLGSDFVSGTYNMADRAARGVGSAIESVGTGAMSLYDSAMSSLFDIQRMAFGPEQPADASQIRRELLQKDPGFAPDSRVREGMDGILDFEPSFARLHAGPESADAARNLNAEAFTIGSDVFFGANRFDPSSTRGLSLLGHELTHVGQQAGIGADRPQFYTKRGGDAMERAAQAAGALVYSKERTGGLIVDNFVCQFDSHSENHETERVKGISDLAYQMASELLSVARTPEAFLETVEVNILLDLERHSDTEAAKIWAIAMVEAIQSAAKSTRSSRAPSHKVQRAPTDAPETDKRDYSIDLTPLTPDEVAKMSSDDKVSAVYARSKELLAPDLKAKLMQLITPRSLVIMGATSAVAITAGLAAQAFPGTWVVDAAALIAGGLLVGGAALLGYDLGGAIKELTESYSAAKEAKTEEDLDHASAKMAEGFTSLGVDGVALLALFLGAGKAKPGAEVEPNSSVTSSSTVQTATTPEPGISTSPEVGEPAVSPNESQVSQNPLVQDPQTTVKAQPSLETPDEPVKSDTGPGADAPVGRRGAPMKVPKGTNVGGTVNGIEYSNHAFDQMQGRGATPSMVEEVLKYGVESQYDKDPEILNYDYQGLRVGRNKFTGVVTTVITRGK